MKLVLKLSLIAVLGGAGYLYHQLVKEQEEMLKLQNQTAKLDYLNRHLATNAFQFANKSPAYIDYLTVTDSKGENHDLYKLIEGGPKLVFRMGFDHCNLCYEAEFDRLKKALPELDKYPVIVLSNFKKRDFLVMINQYQKQFPTVSFLNSEGFLSFRQEDFSQPYYFVLHEDGSSHSFFLPDKVLPQHTFNYFESIVKR